MGPAERRDRILKKLYRCKYETLNNLAFEFGVSPRTIRRDIEVLSLTEPIYTQSGRYGGGVYILDTYTVNRKFISENELEVLQKICRLFDNGKPCVLTKSEVEIIKGIILAYEKPKK